MAKMIDENTWSIMLSISEANRDAFIKFDRLLKSHGRNRSVAIARLVKMAVNNKSLFNQIIK